MHLSEFIRVDGGATFMHIFKGAQAIKVCVPLLYRVQSDSDSFVFPLSQGLQNYPNEVSVI